MDLARRLDALQSQWAALAAQERGLSLLALLLILLLLLLPVLRALSRRRLRDVAQALNDSTRGAWKPTQRRANLVRGDVVPAPDPFVAFSVELGVRGLLGAVPLMGSQQLLLTAQLAKRPAVELVWRRGHTPDRALGRGPETRLWVSRRLDFVPGEYAIRGSNPAPLEHQFVDLQTRFGAFTRSVRILAEAQPQLEIEMEANRLNSDDIPALVTTVRALARAALRG